MNRETSAINRNIVRLAVPNMISNIVIPLLGMVDVAIAGHTGEDVHIAALSIGTTIFNFIYWNCAFLRMGTSGITAQAYGAGNFRECFNMLVRALWLALVIALLLVVFRKPAGDFALCVMQGSDAVRRVAGEYFFVRIWAVPASISLFAVQGWFIGMQDARTPMLVSVAANVLNIALSILFVFGFGMQLKGLALSSALAQWAGFALSLCIWNSRYGHLRKYVTWRSIRRPGGFRPFFKVNGDIFLRSLSLVLVTVFFTSASARAGDTLLAVNSLLMQLFLLFSYIMDGFAYAAEALAGRYTGARDYGSLRLLVRRLFLWGAALAALFTLAYLFFTEDILRLLTDKDRILQASADFRLWALLFPAAGFAAFLWDGVFVGATASRAMRDSMFAAVACFFLIYCAGAPVWGNSALWLSFTAYLAMRSILQTCLWNFRIMRFIERRS
jgi:MATE family multidrug resistance protein